MKLPEIYDNKLAVINTRVSEFNDRAESASEMLQELSDRLAAAYVGITVWDDYSLKVNSDCFLGFAPIIHGKEKRMALVYTVDVSPSREMRKWTDIQKADRLTRIRALTRMPHLLDTIANELGVCGK